MRRKLIMNKNNIIDYITYILGRKLTSEESYRLDDMLNEFAKEKKREGKLENERSSYSRDDKWEFSGGL